MDEPAVSGRASTHAGRNVTSVSAAGIGDGERATLPQRQPVPRQRAASSSITPKATLAAATSHANTPAAPAVAPRRRSGVKAAGTTPSGIPVPSARTRHLSMADTRRRSSGTPTPSNAIGAQHASDSESVSRVAESAPKCDGEKSSALAESWTGDSNRDANAAGMKSEHADSMGNPQQDYGNHVDAAPASNSGAVSARTPSRSSTVVRARQAKPPPPPKDRARLSMLTVASPRAARKPRPRTQIVAAGCNGSAAGAAASGGDSAVQEAADDGDRGTTAARQRTLSGSTPRRKAPVRSLATKPSAKQAEKSEERSVATPPPAPSPVAESPTTATPAFSRSESGSRIPRPVSVLSQEDGEERAQSPTLKRLSASLDCIPGRPRTPSGSRIPTMKTPEPNRMSPSSLVTSPIKPLPPSSSISSSPNPPPKVAVKPKPPPPVAVKTKPVRTAPTVSALSPSRSPSPATSKPPTLPRSPSPATPKNQFLVTLQRTKEQSPSLCVDTSDSPVSTEKPKESRPRSPAVPRKPSPRVTKQEEPPASLSLKLEPATAGGSPWTTRALSPSLARKIFAMGLDAEDRESSDVSRPTSVSPSESSTQHERVEGPTEVTRSSSPVPPTLPPKKKRSVPSTTAPEASRSPRVSRSFLSPEPSAVENGGGATPQSARHSQQEPHVDSSPIKARRSRLDIGTSPTPDSSAASPTPPPRSQSPVPVKRSQSPVPVKRARAAAPVIASTKRKGMEAGVEETVQRCSSPLLLESVPATDQSRSSKRPSLSDASPEAEGEESTLIDAPCPQEELAISGASTEGGRESLVLQLQPVEDVVDGVEELHSPVRQRKASMKRRAPTPPANVKPFSIEDKIKDSLAGGSVSQADLPVGRRHSSPIASPLTRRPHSTSSGQTSLTVGDDGAGLFSTSAPSQSDDNLFGAGGDFLGSSAEAEHVQHSPSLRSKANSLPSLNLPPDESSGGRSGSFRASRRAPPPPRSLKSPPAIEEAPDEPSPSPDSMAGPLYAAINQSSRSASASDDESLPRRPSVSRKRAPPVPTAHSPKTQQRMASANAEPPTVSVSMPSSPLLNKSPPPFPNESPKISRPLPKSPVLPRAEISKVPAPPDSVALTLNEGDADEAQPGEQAYGVRDVSNRVESPVYASIPDLDKARNAKAASDSTDETPPRSESVSPDMPHLTEEEQKQLQLQTEALDDELAVERKTLRSLQQMLKLLDGDKAINVAEKIDKTEAGIKELEKELQKLREIETGERKMDNEQRMRVRQQVINELVMTERGFVHDMELCIQCFLEPLREEDYVDTAHLFGNMEELLNVSRRFLELLERNTAVEGGKEAQLATCFMEMKDDLAGVYAQYCRNHDEACDMLIKLDSNTEYQEKMVSLSEEMRNIHNAKTWDLQSFLIKPVQRVLKYPLLLRELAKYTEFSHPDKKNLKQAMAVMEDVAREINEFKRRKDLMLKYKKSTEEATRVGAGKLTWHSVAKKTSRFTQKIGQATGFTSSTIDKKFHDEDVLFRELERATRQLLKNVQEHVQFTQEMNTLAQRLLTSSQSLYGDTSNSYGAYSQASQYQMGAVFGTYTDRLKSCVVDRLEALLGQFETPRFFIEKRNDKLLDYDSCKNRLEKYKMDPERLKEFQEELKGKQREYAAMNAQLLEDVPKLVTVSLKILLKILASCQRLEQEYCAKCHTVFTDLDSLDMIPSDIRMSDDLFEEHTQRLIDLHEKWKDYKLLPRGWVERTLSATRGSMRGARSMNSINGSMDSLNLSFGRKSSAESVTSGSMSNISMESGFSFDSRASSKKRSAIPSYMRQDSNTSTASSVSSMSAMSMASSTSTATVDYDFEAENSTEISVPKGATVEVLAKRDSMNNADWWKIRHSGREGFIPKTYLSDSGVSDVEAASRQSSASSVGLPPLIEQRQAKRSTHEEPEYAEAAVPSATPATAASTARSTVNPYRAVNVLDAMSDSSSASNSASATPANCLSPEYPGLEDDSPGTPGSQSGRLSRSPSALLPVYKVAFDFEAESTNEVTLVAGQLVKVLQDHDTTGNDDWWLVCQNDGVERGYVPSAYLEEL